MYGVRVVVRAPCVAVRSKTTSRRRQNQMLRPVALALIGLIWQPAVPVTALPVPKAPVSYERVHVGDGVALSVAVAGTGATPMVLLHGFPECSYFWRGVIDPLLEDSSLTLYMPDMRGFNLSSTPPHIFDYNISHLVADTVALIGHTGGSAKKPVHVVGHDWGGTMVAWVLAAKRPELVKTLSILNAPHPSVFDSLLRTDATERKRSSCECIPDPYRCRPPRFTCVRRN
eukprot:SAG31_NODE_894_length_11172_cov_25.790572_5_plen_229_part_00